MKSEQPIAYDKQHFTEEEIGRIKQEVEILLEKHPKFVPVVVRCEGKDLRLLKHKFLVNHDITIAMFMTILRKRLADCVKSEQGLFLLCNNIMPPATQLMSVMYAEHAHRETGLLIFTLCLENTFG